MDTALGVIFFLVIAWFILKVLYFILLAAWEEVGPAARVIWRAVKWLLYLPFAPFVSLWRLVFGYPETEEERRERLFRENQERDHGQSEQEREEQLEAIRKALRID